MLVVLNWLFCELEGTTISSSLERHFLSTFTAPQLTLEESVVTKRKSWAEEEPKTAEKKEAQFLEPSQDETKSGNSNADHGEGGSERGKERGEIKRILSHLASYFCVTLHLLTYDRTYHNVRKYPIFPRKDTSAKSSFSVNKDSSDFFSRNFWWQCRVDNVSSEKSSFVTTTELGKK